MSFQESRIKKLSGFTPNMVLIVLWLALLSAAQSKGQIIIDTTNSASFLVNHILLGDGVIVGNVQYTGQKHGIGLYRDNTSSLGIPIGIVLSSGNVMYTSGPNKTSRAGWASNAPGADELEGITRGQTYDAAILEFDFITQSEHLIFEYIFASEEYPEYVGSKFNDVFAFYVEGPGLPKTNIARLSDGRTPITVNTVNSGHNKDYFRDNSYVNTTDPFIWDVRKRKVIKNKNYGEPEVPQKYNTQFDGFTTILTAECKVIPNKIYHIKLAIADVADGILDSGVILKGGSFRSHGNQTVAIDNQFRQILPKPVKPLKPNLSSVAQIKRSIPKKIKIGTIEFDFDEYIVPGRCTPTLTNVLQKWYENSAGKIYVIGHTDSFGSTNYNLTLSRNRANAVAALLKELGVPEESLIVSHFGESKPLQNNQTPYGRARNRRVELVVGY